MIEESEGSLEGGGSRSILGLRRGEVGHLLRELLVRGAVVRLWIALRVSVQNMDLRELAAGGDAFGQPEAGGVAVGAQMGPAAGDVEGGCGIGAAGERGSG